jgi:hypothetical protein
MKHFTESIVADRVLKDVFRTPAITAYNRLEGRPRTVDYTRSLRAEARDALWFLTRQWQLGELQAEDAASPIDARLATRIAPFDRVSLAGGPSEPYDETVPLEVIVEREAFPWTLPLRIEAAELFLRRVPPAVRNAVAAAARARYTFAADTDWPREPDALALYRIAASRGFDGAQMLTSHDAGTLAVDLGALPADVEPAADAVASWARRVFGTTGRDTAAAAASLGPRPSRLRRPDRHRRDGQRRAGAAHRTRDTRKELSTGIRSTRSRQGQRSIHRTARQQPSPGRRIAVVRADGCVVSRHAQSALLGNGGSADQFRIAQRRRPPITCCWSLRRWA